VSHTLEGRGAWCAAARDELDGSGSSRDGRGADRRRGRLGQGRAVRDAVEAL
jgi:hypothetical protein